MKNNQIFKLNDICLTLQQINISLSMIERLKQLPVYRLQVWLGNQMLDQTADIVGVIQQKEKSLKLSIRNASFRYRRNDLFLYHKVAKLNVKLYRCDVFCANEELFQEYMLVLSQYSYEFGRILTNSFHEHSIGKQKKSFLYYCVQCTYQEQVNNQNKPKQLINIPLLKRNEKSVKQSDSSSPLLDIQNGVLPINSFEYTFGRPKKQKQQEVYISYDRLIPLYQSDSVNEDKIKIRLSRTSLKEDEQKQGSSMQEMTKIQVSAKSYENFMFNIFILIGIIGIIILMFPTERV